MCLYMACIFFQRNAIKINKKKIQAAFPHRKQLCATRREQMLRDKIDYASSKLACNKELAPLVGIAAVSPLPITTSCVGDPIRITWFLSP